LVETREAPDAVSFLGLKKELLRGRAAKEFSESRATKPARGDTQRGEGNEVVMPLLGIKEAQKCLNQQTRTGACIFHYGKRKGRKQTSQTRLAERFGQSTKGERGLSSLLREEGGKKELKQRKPKISEKSALRRGEDWWSDDAGPDEGGLHGEETGGRTLRSFTRENSLAQKRGYLRAK